ncbi:MAG TPA: M13 family metallopeptidase [Bryobacteraceae bacterium]|nr:M13 family metallopeptidase [Bryobacteraceae bacterium]
MHKLTILASLAACALVAQTSPQPAAAPTNLDVGAIDKSADPCVDFYQYACGSWMKKNPIPPDQAMWGTFDELQEHNREVLRQILEEAAKLVAGRDAVTQKIGDYYAACMDEKAIDAKGLAPLEPELARIRDLKDKAQLAGETAHFHAIGADALFDFSSGQDFKDSNSVIAQFDQGGLGLPDRDYYLKDDPKSVELRQKYVAHVQRMLELAGEKPEQAKADAATVMKMETDLAKGSLDLVSRRDPEKVYHRMTRQDLAALGPDFRWNEYFTASGSPSFESLNVSYPEFVRALNAEIQSASLADWKTYLTWHLVHSTATVLPAPFVQENFDFYGKTLAGIEQLRPRWKRCTDYTDWQLGEALGQKYVERTFGAEGKQRTLQMVDALEKALGQDIEKLPWMTPATKKQALVKLHAITNKIGYPDHWRDYSSVVIKRDDALGDRFRADEFEYHRVLNKIGKPVDRGEWDMTPPTVNAYYDPQMNNINFPAGILQPPFFYKSADDAVNFGGIGMVIGHELTHGFDDQGRQFDLKGNLADWWTKEDGEEFRQRAACVADEYSGFSVAPGVHVNGKLTLGEDIADNGGVRIALMALLQTIGNRTGKIDGYTPEQRFFLSFGQIWCTNAREEALRLQVQTNEHSPPRFRINGVVENMPEFQKAFSCKPGQPMVAQHACRVW